VYKPKLKRTMAVAGIYFGNTNSVISVCMNGRVETVSNETGDRITPTIVAYTGTEKVVGQPAKQYNGRNPLSCITNIKSCIGQSFTEEHINEQKKYFSCEVANANGNISYNVKVEDKIVPVSSVEASSYILTKLLEIAELVGGDDLEDVVIAVPSTFSEEQTLGLREAAESVGCNILRVISEPAAALHAYGIGQADTKADCKVLVYRLGGSSTDATLLEVKDGMYRSIAQKVDKHFGADDFSDQLVKNFVQDFKRKHKEDISNNKRAIGKLKIATELCKHGLSQMQTTACTVDSLFDGIDFNSQVPRAKFETICSSLFSKSLSLVEELLTESNTKHKDVDKIILIGGGSRMPRLIKLFTEKFPSSEMLNSINPDEVISNGAALQAALLAGREDITSINNCTTKLDCFSRNIGLKTKQDDKEILEIIISKNTPVPLRKSKKFEAPASQTSACVCIYEINDDGTQTENLLAKIALKDLGDEKDKDFTLSFEINRNGVLLITLSESTSKRHEKVTIEIHESS